MRRGFIQKPIDPAGDSWEPPPRPALRRGARTFVWRHLAPGGGGARGSGASVGGRLERGWDPPGMGRHRVPRGAEDAPGGGGNRS